ncbi:Armadillo repeat-containing protein 8 [Galdieria sulphuraria]|nr:Armadillo repeat-containing protein 8 [Galdieria sulphuraria]
MKSLNVENTRRLDWFETEEIILIERAILSKTKCFRNRTMDKTFVEGNFCLEKDTTDTLKETVKRIKNLCVGHPAKKREYIQQGIIPSLLKLIDRNDSELTWQICGTIGILANNNVTGAEQVVSASGLSTLLSLLSSNDERLVKQASQCILSALKSAESPVKIFLENVQLLESVCSLLCYPHAPTSVRECTSVILTSCLEKAEFDQVMDWSRISNFCFEKIKSYNLSDPRTLTPYLTILKSLTMRNREIGKQFIEHNLVELLVEIMRGVDMAMKTLACRVYTNLMNFSLLSEDQASKDTAVIIMPLLNRMLSNTDKNIRLEGCKMLTQVVAIGEIYQKQAFDCNLVHCLIDLGRCISISDIEAACILLQAVAAVCSLVEECRHLVIESRLFSLVVNSLDTSYPDLRIAGLSALRSLSRSVRNLRASLAEAVLMEPLLRSLSDENKQVQIQALSTISMA